MAGNQFSFPLIDFEKAGVFDGVRWESVLLPPDRLLNILLTLISLLGISSPSP
ncbi:hypothetical protein HMPREF0972_02428 [Actinomyces sp. oral taxon 848 str. F0332]|nr:hypothetical protein HMPREF0972_02428 [Actinomyces sp. oral taxon 848 str. F0332]